MTLNANFLAIENDDLDLTCTYIKDINKIYLKIKSWFLYWTVISFLSIYYKLFDFKTNPNIPFILYA